MELFPTTVILASSFFLLGCNHHSETTLNYRSLRYDSPCVKIFDWDTSYSMEFPNNSDPLPLSQKDILKVDSILVAEVHHYNETTGVPTIKSFLKSGFILMDSADVTIDFKKYRCQYFPYKDVNGEAIVLAYCFCKPYQLWKSMPYRMSQSDRGTQYFLVKINLTKNFCDGLSTAGYL